jgi:RNA polymerase sigma factor (sigma-70 family)
MYGSEAQHDARRMDGSVEPTEALVFRARNGDSAAFTQLIGRYERMALSVAFGVLGNGDAAGDVVQEAFLRAWQRLAELKEPARFGTWLCGVVRNLAIDTHRRARHSKNAVDVGSIELAAAADDRGCPDPLNELSRRERHAMVGRAIQSLDDVTRPIVTMRYYDGLSSKEIGEALQLSPAAVDMRLSRARAQLKKLLASVISETSH